MVDTVDSKSTVRKDVRVRLSLWVQFFFCHIFIYIMEKPTDFVKQRVPFNWAQFIAILFFAISSTFALTKIYDRFELLETKHHEYEQKVDEKFKILEKKVDDNDANQTRRLDTKTGRNSDEIKKLKGE